MGQLCRGPPDRGMRVFFFFQAEDGIRDYKVTGVQTCALPISSPGRPQEFLPIACGSARVRVQHRVAVGCEQLKFVVEGAAGCSMRTSVNAENQDRKSVV